MTVNVSPMRGINVGGKNNLPMQDLREILSRSTSRTVEKLQAMLAEMG